MHCLSFLLSEAFIQLSVLKPVVLSFYILRDWEMLPSHCFLVMSCKSDYWDFFFFWCGWATKQWNVIHRLSYWLQFLSHFLHNLICFYYLYIIISFPFLKFGCSLPSLGCWSSQILERRSVEDVGDREENRDRRCLGSEKEREWGEAQGPWWKECSKKVVLFMTISTQLIFWNILNEITFLISKHQLHHCFC